MSGSSDLFPPPPRKVPFALRAKLLFGGARRQASWLMLGLSVSFFFVLAFDASSFRYFRGDLNRAEGAVVSSKRTLFTTGVFSSGGALHDPGYRIFRHCYEFAVDGNKHAGASYGPELRKNEVASITIEYLKNNPTVSRIQGMTPGIHLKGGGVSLIIVVAIITIALVSVVKQMLKGSKYIHLLKYGRWTMASVVSRNLLSRNTGRE